MLKRAVACALSTALVLSCVFVSHGAIDVSAEENITALSSGDLSGGYKEYIEANKDLPFANSEFFIDAVKDNITENPEIKEIGGEKFLITTDEGETEWKFNVPESGIYSVSVVWANDGGKGLDIIRKIKLDGEIPFGGLNSVYFRRVWKNSGEIYVDGSGNEYSKKLTEEVTVQNTKLYSVSDYVSEGYCFALTKGEHTIAFEAIQEPMAISKIIFSPAKDVKKYSEIKKEYKANGYKEISKDTKPLIIEAEKQKRSSQNILRPDSDQSSPELSPYNAMSKVINVSGGDNWKNVTEWIEWDFKAPKAGLYKVVFHAKQGSKPDFSSIRKLVIDGEVPFKEAETIGFEYDLDWQSVELSDGKELYLLYLEEGEHTLRLEVSLTENMAQIIKEATAVQNDLIEIYRKILMVTGSNPDSLRDYNLFANSKGCKEALSSILSGLEVISKDLKALGYSGSETSSMDRLIIQLGDFIKDENSIPERLDTFNSNIMTFSTWLSTVSQQPLLLDYIWLGSPKSPTPEADSGFFKKFFNEIYRLVLSFVLDYDVMDSAAAGKTDKQIKLWIGQGIDQSIVLKSMIDGSFTPKSNIAVNMELVNMGVLLPAVAAGVGPDVALFQGESTPVEYAMRGAAYDLKKFKDLDDVLSKFYPSAYESFKYEGGLYALPETQVFSLMFYRTDIFEDMNLKVPNTWQELYETLAFLQTNNLSISVASPFESVVGAGINGIYLMLLYQNGGSVYAEDATHTTINSEEGIEAFIEWTELYTKYKIPQTTNLTTRFRMGESPLVISGYGFYNSLQISAPEIEGKWDIAPVPATVKPDGTLDRSQASTVTGCMIFSNSSDPDSSWEFIKWWTGAEAQSEYGMEIEALQGASARWSTANREAFETLPWTNRIAKVLRDQWGNVKGIPHIAGGYYTSRSIDNAVRTVVNEHEDPRETLLDFAADIDEEITIKRKEFGLSVKEDE